MDFTLNLTSSNSSNGTEFDRHFSCYDLQTAPQWALSIHASILCAVTIASVILGIIVVILILKFKQLRHSAAIVSLSLVSVDLFMVLSTHMPSLVSTVAKKWVFGESGCSIFGTWALSILLTRLCIMAVLAFDRFARVKFPFSYKRRARYIVVSLIITAWGVPAVMVYCLMHAKDFRWIGFRQHIPTCHINCPFDPQCRGVYGSLLTAAYFIGAVIPTVLYSWLYYRARKLRPTATALGRVSITAASGAVITIPAARLENKDSKRIVTFILIFVTFFLTGLPVYLFQIVRTDYDAFCRIPIFLQFIVIDIFSISTALDPLLIMRDRDFRQCLKILVFCCKRKPKVWAESNESSSSDFFDGSHSTARRFTLESIIYRVSSTLSLDQASRSRRSTEATLFSNPQATSADDNDSSTSHPIPSGATLRVPVEHCGLASPAGSLSTLHETLEEESDSCSRAVVFENPATSSSLLEPMQSAEPQERPDGGIVFDIALVYPTPICGTASEMGNSMCKHLHTTSYLSTTEDSFGNSIYAGSIQNDTLKSHETIPEQSNTDSVSSDTHISQPEVSVRVPAEDSPKCSEDRVEQRLSYCETRSTDFEMSLNLSKPAMQNIDSVVQRTVDVIPESSDIEEDSHSRGQAVDTTLEVPPATRTEQPGSHFSSFSSCLSENSLIESVACEVD